MSCADCGEIISTSDIINSCFQQLFSTVERHYHSKQQVTRQQARYNYSTFQREVRYGSIHIHVSHGKWLCFRKEQFWGNTHIQELLLKYRFEEHSPCHKASCFKKGCECRFLFPFMSTTSTYIHEDKGDKNENGYIVVFTRWINKRDISLRSSTKKKPWVASTLIHTICPS